jgi:hypothetical protein
MGLIDPSVDHQNMKLNPETGDKGQSPIKNRLISNSTID